VYDDLDDFQICFETSRKSGGLAELAGELQGDPSGLPSEGFGG